MNGLDDNAPAPGDKPVLIVRCVVERAVRVVAEADERLGTEEPGKVRVLVAHLIGNRVHGDEAGTLSAVPPVVGRVESRRPADVWELARVEVVHTPLVVAPHSIRTFATSQPVACDRRPIYSAVETDALLPGLLSDRIGIPVVLDGPAATIP